MRGIYCTSTVPCAFVSASNDSIKIYSAVKNTCYSNCKRCFCLFVVMILLFSYVVNDVSLGKHFQLTDFLLNNMLFQHIVQHDVAICCQFLQISAIEKRGPPKTHLPPSSSGPHFRVSDLCVSLFVCFASGVHVLVERLARHCKQGTFVDNTNSDVVSMPKRSAARSRSTGVIGGNSLWQRFRTSLSRTARCPRILELFFSASLVERTW